MGAGSQLCIQVQPHNWLLLSAFFPNAPWPVSVSVVLQMYLLGLGTPPLFPVFVQLQRSVMAFDDSENDSYQWV